MDRTVAAIDIGTNSVRLAKGYEINGRVIVTEKKLNTTRLGEGTADTDALKVDAMRRTVEAIHAFAMEAKQEGYNLVGIYATSAVREASNRDCFLDMANNAGYEIEVLSGEEESKIAFNGVTQGNKGCYSVADIGGGSTEISYGSDGQLVLGSSVRIGAVRMTQRYSEASGEVSKKNQETFFNECVQTFSEMSVGIPRDAVLYGVGGTFTTLAAMDQQMKIYDPERIQDYKLTLASIHNMRVELCEKSSADRLAIPGLMPKRADIIACACIIAESVLTAMHQESIHISERDGLDGFLIERCLF